MNRRSRFTYNVSLRRLADFNHRAARFRTLTLAAVAVTLAVADAAPWTWLVFAVAGVGAYQALVGSWHELHGREPREPLARWALRSAVDGRGQQSVNVSGVIEDTSTLGLAAASVWGTDEPVARLVLMLLAVAWATSAFSCVFIDAAFYNPDVRPS